MQVYDMSNLSTPKLSGTGVMRHYAYWRTEEYEYAAVFKELPEGNEKVPLFEVHILNVDSANGGTETDEIGAYESPFADNEDSPFPFPIPFKLDGSTAYITHYVGNEGIDNVLEAIDLSDPTNPTLIGYFQTPSTIGSVAINNGFVYITAGKKLYVLLMYSG